MYSLAPIAEEVSSDDGSFADDDEDYARLSTSGDSEATASPSMLPLPVPLFTPYPALAVANFLTEDDGTSIIGQDEETESDDEGTAADADIREPPTASPVAAWLAGVPTRVFTESSSAISSVTSHLARASSYFSIDSVVEHFTARSGEKSFPLAEFCKLIDDHPSLERAKILSVECYTEPIRFGIVHRTLIFHLCRERRSDIWMRVDRRRSHHTPFLMFALRGGRTEANDVALLAGTKADLLNGRSAVLENRMGFEAPPNLGVFRFCLQVICEELLQYHIWPENCWFMCSLLQEHLSETGQGLFRYGSPIRLNLAPRIRARVRDRVWHVVTPSSTAAGSLTGKDISTPPPDFTPRWKTIDGGFDTRDFDFPSLGNYIDVLIQTMERHHQNLTNAPSREDLRVSIVELAERAIWLEFILRQGGAAASSSSAVDFLSSHYSYLHHHASLPRHPLFLYHLRFVYQTAPQRVWHGTVSRLVHAARSVSTVNPAASRTYAQEARSIITAHLEGERHWTDGQVLTGHTDSVTCVAFSPDGKQIASASIDKTIRRWDALTGESIGEPMRGHTELVLSVAYSPNGRQIVSGSDDNTLRRWDASSGQPISAPMQGHTDYVLCVAHSPDGKLIASGSADQSIRRWGGFTGETVGEPLGGHAGSVLSIAFSPDGERIVSGSRDRTIRLWDAITGEAVGEPWKGHESYIFTVAFSPDGAFIVSGSWDRTVRRWDALTGESIGKPMTGHTGHVYCVAVSPDGKHIASASDDCTIRLWDVTTGEMIGGPLEGHTGRVRSVAFSPDGRQIVSGSEDH